jgi:hypothetical protein
MEDILTGFPNFKGQFNGQPIKSGAPIASRAKAGVVISPDRKRSIYTQVLANKNINAENSIISEGYIRVETVLSNGKGVYDFTFVSSNKDSLTERKIDRNDKFLVTEIGFFLMNRIETKKGAEVLQSYPNPVVFVSKANDNSIAKDLEAIYNGFISVKVGQTKFIEGMDLLRFRNVPQTQQSGSSANSQSAGKMGFFETTPQILLAGDQKNEIRIELPIDANSKIASDVTDTNNYVVLFCRGFLISSK